MTLPPPTNPHSLVCFTSRLTPSKSEASQTEKELEKELLDVDDFLAEYFDTPHGHRDTIDDNLDLLDEILAEHATDRI